MNSAADPSRFHVVCAGRPEAAAEATRRLWDFCGVSEAVGVRMTSSSYREVDIRHADDVIDSDLSSYAIDCDEFWLSWVPSKRSMFIEIGHGEAREVIDIAMSAGFDSAMLSSSGDAYAAAGYGRKPGYCVGYSPLVGLSPELALRATSGVEGVSIADVPWGALYAAELSSSAMESMRAAMRPMMSTLNPQGSGALDASELDWVATSDLEAIVVGVEQLLQDHDIPRLRNLHEAIVDHLAEL